MKKFNVLFTALLCASVMFVGCSEDEETDGNGNGAGNGGSGVIVKSKKVSRVIKTVSEGIYADTDTTDYAYDGEGRLSKITSSNDVNTITYASDKITIKDDNRIETIELKNGRASMCSIDDTQETEQTTYSYSGNYISEQVVKYDATDTDKNIFSIENGNLVKIDIDYVEDDDNGGIVESTDYEIGSVDNNMNIDLVYGDIYDFSDYAALLCVTGDRFKNLPKTETYKEDGKDYITNYVYVQNEDGYVTQITKTSSEYSTVYDITYE